VAVSAHCPSCGAPVVFKSASSVFAVCEYCQSTLVRHDQNLEDIGKMAALVEDRSPLQLGSEGSYQGVHFALIGRIQIKYSQGIWNEWHLLFDDMRTGWLSEAAGEYVLTFAQYVGEPLPQFDDLKIGQRFVLASQTWTVSNIEKAECIAGQGELPFKVGAGYPVAAVDLRNRGNFATLDYSETPPLLFVGEAVDFKSLKMANLREGMAEPTATIEARVFRCPSCGSPMQARSAQILAVGCGACGAVVDTADQNAKILSKAFGMRDEKVAPLLPLGSKGKLEDKPVEVIGFLVKQSRVDGIAFDWREYLLAGDGPQNRGTYRWLTEYNGHWNVADVLSNPPATSGAMELADVRWSGQNFKHFSTTPNAEVIQVAGEFTWRVRRGETSRVVDYVAPPLMLSRESTGNDLNWSQGFYMAPEAIAEAFRLPARLPDPIGVFANQPNAWAETNRRIWRLFGKLALTAVVVQFFFVFLFSGKLLLRQDFTFEPRSADEVQTREFDIIGKPRKLAVHNATSLDNNWIGLDMMLVNKATGAAWPAARELSFYSGNNDGYWSEGSREDEVVFLNIPAGTYYLTLDPDMAPEKPVAVRDRVEVRVAGAGWSNFVLVMIFLIIFPIFTAMRHAAFEARRWAESDHAPVSSDDADGDD
jgi:ribosomal protein L37AE/L43A